MSDLQFAARLLRRSPVWTTIAALSLALGIGANAVVFSLVDAVLLDPFPYRDSGRLVLLWGSRSETQTTGISGADLRDWRDESETFEDIDAFLGGNMAYSLGPGEGDRVKAACIGHRVLPILGVQPALGRNFTEDDTRDRGEPVVLISDALWRSRYASDPRLVGSTIRLDDRPHVVVGVTPPGFFFPDTDARLWVPAPCGLPGFDSRGAMTLNAIGRLRPGVSRDQAQADINRINAALARAYPETNKLRTTGVFPLRHIVVGRYERALWTLGWSIGLVLLIACANVAHLQLARGVERETELAIRAAAGAGRLRLLRQLMTESGVLVAISAALGLIVAYAGVGLIHAFALTDIPRMESARIDARVLAFTLIVSVLTALISGLWPAVKASAVNVGDALKLGSGGTSGAAQSRVRDLLAITEIAAAVTLLVASGLVVRSFVHLSRADWGFNPDRLLLIDVRAPDTAAEMRAIDDDLVENLRRRLRAVPGVERVAVGTNAPIRWTSWAPRPVAVDGRVLTDLTAGVWVVGRGHFGAAGIPIDAGREFSDADDAAAPRRAVVSRAFAARVWPGQSAIGKSLEILRFRTVNGKPDPSVRRRLELLSRTMRGYPADRDLYEVEGGTAWEVIGVAADVRMFGLDTSPNPAVYLELRQQPSLFRRSRGAKILLRTTGDPLAVAAAAKAQIRGVSPHLTFAEVVPLASLVSQSIGGRGSNKLLLIVAAVFGSLALLFATIGIYGVVAHNVTQRLREIGIRVALGASRRDIVRIVVGYGARLMASGLALGVTAAWAATRGMKTLLFGTATTDPLTYVMVILVLAIAALLACVAPLRRASRIDPVVLFKA